MSTTVKPVKGAPFSVEWQAARVILTATERRIAALTPRAEALRAEIRRLDCEIRQIRRDCEALERFAARQDQP